MNYGSWVLKTKEDWIRFFQYAKEHPEDESAQKLIALIPSMPQAVRNMYDDWLRQQALIENAEKSGDWNSVYRDATSQGLTLDPTVEKYVDNQIAQSNTEQAQSFERDMRDTAVTSAGNQLESLGLSRSVVSSIGGISSPGVAAADNSFGSRSMDRQQIYMQKYQTRMGLTKGLLGMISQMASSGIYGAAIGGARNAAARLATATAHSGLQALQNMRPELRNQLMKDDAARRTAYDPYQLY